MPKALAAPDGEPLVLQSLRTLQEAGVAPIVVVIGAAADEVRALIAGAGQHDVILVDNPDWESGMGSSLRAGLAALTSLAAPTSPAVDATAVLLVDTPGITPAAVARVAEIAEEGSGALAAGSYGGTQGHPVLLGRDHWAGVSEQAIEDVGARPYLRDHASDLLLVPCDDVADGRDIDTPYRGRHAAPDGS
jgi:nicotine blue oxidoreductase